MWNIITQSQTLMYNHRIERHYLSQCSKLWLLGYLLSQQKFLGILFLLLMELSASIWYIKTDIAEIIKYLSYAAVVFMMSFI